MTRVKQRYKRRQYYREHRAERHSQAYLGVGKALRLKYYGYIQKYRERGRERRELYRVKAPVDFTG
jgi:hypothetical protein